MFNKKYMSTNVFQQNFAYRIQKVTFKRQNWINNRPLFQHTFSFNLILKLKYEYPKRVLILNFKKQSFYYNEKKNYSFIQWTISTALHLGWRLQKKLNIGEKDSYDTGTINNKRDFRERQATLWNTFFIISYRRIFLDLRCVWMNDGGNKCHNLIKKKVWNKLKFCDFLLLFKQLFNIISWKCCIRIKGTFSERLFYLRESGWNFSLKMTCHRPIQNWKFTK